MIDSSRYDDRRLKLLAALARGRSVLDVGYAQQPNPHLHGFHRVGIDLARPSPDASFRYEEELVGDVRDISGLLAGRTFDSIICAEVVEHLENPYQLLRDLRPLLGPGGRLLVSTPNPLAPPVIFAEALRLKQFFYTRDHLYYFLPRWVERLFDATGYAVERVKPVGLWTPWCAVPYVPVAMSYQVIYVGRSKAG
jgi:2-polyprenyl-3-methyl-5-hydroxy-6-metoxy-1,4-benzoquinol methylase